MIKLDGKGRYCLGTPMCKKRATWMEKIQDGNQEKEMAYCDDHVPKPKAKEGGNGSTPRPEVAAPKLNPWEDDS